MKKLLFILAFGLMITPAFGAESLTQSLQAGNNINVLKLTFVTDGSGNFTATDTAYNIDGWVVLVESDPVNTPTDNFDVTLKNAQGVDVMGGSLTDLDQTNTELHMPLLDGNYTAVPVTGPLTFDVTGAGNDKSGIIRIYFIQ